MIFSKCYSSLQGKGDPSLFQPNLLIVQLSRAFLITVSPFTATPSFFMAARLYKSWDFSPFLPSSSLITQNHIHHRSSHNHAFASLQHRLRHSFVLFLDLHSLFPVLGCIDTNLPRRKPVGHTSQSRWISERHPAPKSSPIYRQSHV